MENREKEEQQIMIMCSIHKSQQLIFADTQIDAHNQFLCLQCVLKSKNKLCADLISVDEVSQNNEHTPIQNWPAGIEDAAMSYMESIIDKDGIPKIEQSIDEFYSTVERKLHSLLEESKQKNKRYINLLKVEHAKIMEYYNETFRRKDLLNIFDSNDLFSKKKEYNDLLKQIDSSKEQSLTTLYAMIETQSKESTKLTLEQPASIYLLLERLITQIDFSSSNLLNRGGEDECKDSAERELEEINYNHSNINETTEIEEQLQQCEQHFGSVFDSAINIITSSIQSRVDSKQLMVQNVQNIFQQNEKLISKVQQFSSDITNTAKSEIERIKEALSYTLKQIQEDFRQINRLTEQSSNNALNQYRKIYDQNDNSYLDDATNSLSDSCLYGSGSTKNAQYSLESSVRRLSAEKSNMAQFHSLNGLSDPEEKIECVQTKLDKSNKMVLQLYNEFQENSQSLSTIKAKIKSLKKEINNEKRIQIVQSIYDQQQEQYWMIRNLHFIQNAPNMTDNLHFIQSNIASLKSLNNVYDNKIWNISQSSDEGGQIVSELDLSRGKTYIIRFQFSLSFDQVEKGNFMSLGLIQKSKKDKLILNSQHYICDTSQNKFSIQKGESIRYANQMEMRINVGQNRFLISDYPRYNIILKNKIDFDPNEIYKLCIYLKGSQQKNIQLIHFTEQTEWEDF